MLHQSNILRKSTQIGRIRLIFTCPNRAQQNVQDKAPIEVDAGNKVENEKAIERKRNKSRLRDHDRRMLHEDIPNPGKPVLWQQGTIRYMRQMYGRYGSASGVDPSLCWPVEQEFKDKLEYERVAYPFTIQQMAEDAAKKKHEADEEIRKRQADIAKKLEKLEDWKADLRKRLAKKEGDALAAKLKKERLLEEVRMHFGFTVDPKDEKFKELLEKKEKEQKKIEKEARRKAKEEQLVAKMLSKKTDKIKDTDKN